MKKTYILIFLVFSAVCFTVLIACRKTPAVPAAVLLQSNSAVACEPTPFNSGNAQIITASSSYTITEVDVFLVNYNCPNGLTYTVTAVIQGTTIGVDFWGNTLDVPNGVTLTGGVSTNVFDTSVLPCVTWKDCTKAVFHFSGCSVTTGQKYSLVLIGDIPFAVMGINDDLLHPVAGQPWDFVSTYSGVSYWQKAKRIEYYIY